MPGPAIPILLIAATFATGAIEVTRATAGAVPRPLDYSFEVGMVRGSFWNPRTLRNDPVELRSYRGAAINDGDFIAPPIRVRPGQTLRVRLDNRLPPCTVEEMKTEPCRNDTNLHTHGLWISPAGNSDNVMISIPPGGSFNYEFRIPDEHPAGTFWYHPHRHGSGMYQLGSGMAGALIVEGSRLPTENRPGDVDILLRNDRGRPFPERILVFQNIPYACAFDADGYPRMARDGEGKRIPQTLCQPGEVGRVERFTQFVQPADSGPGGGRFYALNGKVQPILRGAVAGRFERWRIVTTGFHGVIRLGLRRLAPDAPDLATVPGAEHPQWIDRYCTGALPAWQLAHDGLTRPEIRKANDSTVIPGGRIDLLTWFPEPGRYCLLQIRPPEAHPATRPVLGLIEVGGRTTRIEPDAELRRLLVQAVRRALRGGQHLATRERVIADLENGLRLSSFVPHRSIPHSELTGQQTVEFRTVGPERNGEFLVDGRKFDHNRIDRHLMLGGVEEWRINVPADGQPHIFHIHVNPFQVVSILNAKGEDRTDPASPAYNPFYAGLTGQWLDTVLVEPSTTVVMRTRYQRFTGDIMLHCHLVAHSDLGMMQHIRIHLPGAEETHIHH